MRTNRCGPGPDRSDLRLLLLCMLGMMGVLHCGAQPGSLDASFNPPLSACSSVSVIALQPDGKIVYAASVPCLPFKSPALGRLNSDGNIDSGFALSLFTNGIAHSIVQDSNGRIIVGGSFQGINNEARTGLARLLSDGELDTSFNPALGPGMDVLALAIQADGRILIGGQFTNVNGVNRNGVARLQSDGSLDLSFDPGTGVGDFGPNEVHSVIALSTGKVLLCGAFTNFNGAFRARLARLNVDGSLDATFDPGVGADQVITGMAVQPDGKILVGGEFTLVGGNTRRRVARLNADGSFDPSFNPAPGITISGVSPPVPGLDTVTAVQLAPDGRVLISGSFGYINGVSRPGLARLMADGTLDYDFDAGGTQFGGFSVNTMAVQTNGQVAVGGGFSSVGSVTRNGLARLNGDGAGGPGRFEFSSAQYLVNEGVGSAVLTVLRTGGSLGAATVSYSTADGTAHAPARYTPASGVLIFTNGEVRKTFLVPIVDDHIAENQGCCSLYTDVINGGFVQWELFSIQLQNPTGGAVIGSQDYSLVIIEDNDTAFSFSEPNYTVGELDGLATVNIERTGNRNGTNAVSCFTIDGTAIVGRNYLSNSTSIVFAPGEITKSFRFLILEDPVTNGQETVSVSLTNPTGGAFLAGFSNAIVTIQDQPGIIISTLPGTVDTNFIPGLGIDGSVDALAYMGGRLFAAGYFSSVDDIPRTNVARMNSNGGVDATFDPGIGPNGAVLALAAQADGKILIGGSFTQVQGVPRNHVARLNLDGSLDLGFDPGPAEQGDFGVIVSALALQNDGRVIVAGNFTSFNGVPRHWVARLDSNGSLDSGFDPGSGPDGGVNPFPTVHVVGLEPDGKVVIAGDFTSFAGNASHGVARLNSDGSLDTAFNPGAAQGIGVNALAIQSDGKMILGGWCVTTNCSILARLNIDGSIDSTFETWGPTLDAVVRCLALQGDGKLLVGGAFTKFNGALRTNILRLNTDGKLDVTFDPGSGANDAVIALALRSDGTVAMGGDFTRVNGRLRVRLAQLIGGDPPRTAPALTRPLASQTVVEGANVTFSVVATGFPLPAFQWSFNGQVISAATNASLMISNVVLSQAGTYSVIVTNELGFVSSTAGLSISLAPTQPGALDLSFYSGSGIGSSDSAYPGFVDAAAVTPQGKVLIGGVFSSINAIARSSVAQLNSDGSVDPTFDPGSGVENGGVVQAIATQPDSKALIAGWFFRVDGVPKPTIARLNPDGTVDNSFDAGSGASYRINDLAIQSDGKILVGGDFVYFNSLRRQGVARLNSDGSVDPAFDPGTGTPADSSGGVFALALQTDGKILMGGSFNYVAGQTRAGIARLNSDGSLDPGFNPAAAVNGAINKLAVQTDGKILLSGFFTQVNGSSRNGIARLNADGSLDTNFDSGTGAGGLVWTMALQNYGRVLLGGSFTNFNGVPRNGLARLNPDGSLDLGMHPGAGVDAPVYTIALQGDGRVLVGGSFTNFDGRPRSGIARLLNNATAAAGRLEFSVSSQFIPENSLTNLVLNVRRLGGSNGIVQVNYGVSGGTATTGADFLPVSGTLAFEDGDTGEKGVALSVVNDQTAEGNETITLWLGNPIGGAVWGPQAASTVTILDDDVALDFATNRFLVREDQGGLVVEVRRLGNTSGVVSANYATSDGTAKAGIDYVPQNGTLVFAAGETNKTFVLPILDDWLAEEAETFTVTLSQATGGAQLGTNSPALLTILDRHRPGTIDASFDPGFGVTMGSIFGQAQVNSLAVQADGRILLGGNFDFFNWVSEPPLVRLFPDGTLDTNYLASIPGGLVPSAVSLITLQPDGKALVLAGTQFGSRQLIRLTTNGIPDASFTASALNGSSFTLALQPDGKILVGGTFADTNGTQKGVLRLNTDGALDPAFVPADIMSDFSFPAVTCLTIGPDGKIIIGGGFSAVSGVSRRGLARLASNGSLDRTFDPGTGLADEAGTYNFVQPKAMVLQPDGKLVVAGAFAQVNGAFHTNIVRLNPDGSVDAAFNPSVVNTFGLGSVSALAIQPDNRILLGGTFATVNGVSRNGIARLQADGSLDAQFHLSQDSLGLIIPFFNVQVYTLALQPDGQVLIGGDFFLVDGETLNGIARVNGLPLSPNYPVLHVISQASGRFKVRFTGATGQSYFIEASPDLIHWSSLGRPAESTIGAFEFEDPNSGQVSQRYYRVFSP